MKELKRLADANIVIALAGNKCDLDTRRAVPTEDGQAYADENQLLFYETSAKNSHNVQELFTGIARKLPLDQASGATKKHTSTIGRVDLNARTEGDDGNECAC